jgi:hypothetical protein
MKATHKGSCQGCGAVQKLPGGVLAKHGYTTRWGFFSGICGGSNWKPFETHTDLIERFVANAEEKKRNNEEFIAKLQAKPTEAKGWINVYRTGNHMQKSGYYWVETQFEMRQGKYDSKPVAYYLNPDPKREGQWLNCYTHAIQVDWTIHATATILDYVAVANAKKAAAVAAENVKIQEYINWQRKRIAEWKEQPLLPVEEGR